VPNYRLYFVGPDGHFINRRDIEAADDAEAIATARDLAKGNAIEVWQGNNLVTKVDQTRGMPGNLFKLFRRRTPGKGRST
jgi:hypothetical protein